MASPHRDIPPHGLVVIALVRRAAAAVRGVSVDEYVETSPGSLTCASELLAARHRELGPNSIENV